MWQQGSAKGCLACVSAALETKEDRLREGSEEFRNQTEHLDGLAFADEQEQPSRIYFVANHCQSGCVTLIQCVSNSQTST
jgi:hypothetical protein